MVKIETVKHIFGSTVLVTIIGTHEFSVYDVEFIQKKKMHPVKQLWSYSL